MQQKMFFEKKGSKKDNVYPVRLNRVRCYLMIVFSEPNKKQEKWRKIMNAITL